MANKCITECRSRDPAEPLRPEARPAAAMDVNRAASRIQAIYRSRKARMYIRTLVAGAFEKYADPTTGDYYYVNKVLQCCGSTLLLCVCTRRSPMYTGCWTLRARVSQENGSDDMG